MPLGGRNERSFRVSTIVLPIFAAIAFGISLIGHAGAIDEPRELRNTFKREPMGRPARIEPGQKRFTVTPLPGRPVVVPGPAPAPAPQRYDNFGKRTLDRGTLNSGTLNRDTLNRDTLNRDTLNSRPIEGRRIGRIPPGKDASGRPPLGKGPFGKDAADKSKSDRGVLGKGTPPGKAPGRDTAARAPFGKGAFGKGRDADSKAGADRRFGAARPGFGNPANARSIFERRRLEMAHRREIFTTRLRLPPRPLPGERGFTGVPPRTETRFVANEVMFQAGPNVSPQAVEAAIRRLGLTAVGSQSVSLTGGTMLHLRYADGRQISDVVRALEAERIGIAQPDYVYTVQQDMSSVPQNVDADVGQYVVDKLRLGEVHRVASGKNVLVAVIDSEIDATHPDLAGAIVDQFDADGRPADPDAHGTGMVGAIAAHRRLMGIAPDARILAVRAFTPNSGKSPQATTRQIIAGLEWAIQKGARVVNMSFAGPYDPMLQLAMKKAHDKGVVLIAAAGNLGPKSPPLYPAADPHVIAVTATDKNDRLFEQAVRGPHVAVAAPGVDIMVPAPSSTYQITTGTSVAAAHVSGVAALLIERYPSVDAETVLEVLTSTAKRLNPKGRDDQFGWGLIDPAAALAELDARMATGEVARPAAPAGTPVPAPKLPAPKPGSISAR